MFVDLFFSSCVCRYHVQNSWGARVWSASRPLLVSKMGKFPFMLKEEEIGNAAAHHLNLWRVARHVNLASFPPTQPPIPSFSPLDHQHGREPLCQVMVLFSVHWFLTHDGRCRWRRAAAVLPACLPACRAGPEQGCQLSPRREYKRVSSCRQPAFYKYVWSDALHYFLIKSVRTTASSQRHDA